MVDAKSTPSYSSDLHFSVLKCHCWTYDDNVGPKLKKNMWFVRNINQITLGPRFVQKRRNKFVYRN